MARDTKPNLRNEQFEQLSGDTMTLRGLTEIHGTLEAENSGVIQINSGGTLQINEGATLIGFPSGEVVAKSISQTSHGFVVGEVIGFSGTTYVKAIADGSFDGETLGVVSEVSDVNTFTLTSLGFIDTLTGLSANTTYYLSDATAGELTATEPTADQSISKPIFVTTTATEGYVLNYRPLIISTGGTGGGADGVVSGATLNSTTLELSRTEGLADVTVNLSGLTSGGITGATNGLTDDGTTVSLGGTLTSATVIDTNSVGLTISGGTGGIESRIVNTSAGNSLGLYAPTYSSDSIAGFNHEFTGGGLCAEQRVRPLTGGTNLGSYFNTNITLAGNYSTAIVGSIDAATNACSQLYTVSVPTLGTGFRIVTCNGSDIQAIESAFGSGGMVVTDSISDKGLEYADDYSPNFTARSIPDVAYVTGLTSGATADGVVSGGTLNGTILELGRTEGLGNVNVELSGLTTPAGSNTEIQYNDNGSLGASSNFTFNESTRQLNVAGDVAISGTSFLRAGNVISSVELGQNANTGTQTNAIAIGTNAVSTGGTSIAMGLNTTTCANNSVGIGRDIDIKNGSTSSVAIGDNVVAYGSVAIGIGNDIITCGGSIVMGNSACSPFTDNVVIGENACAPSGGSNTVVGRQASSLAGIGVAIGNGAQTRGGCAVSVGTSSYACTGGVAVGCRAYASADNSMAFGRGSIASGSTAFAVGFGSVAGGSGSIAINGDAFGSNSISMRGFSSAASGIAIGSNTCASGITSSIAMGVSAKALNSANISIGLNAGDTTGVVETCAINIGRRSGFGTEPIGTSSIAIGNTSCSLSTSSVSIGTAARSCSTSAIAIGASSSAYGISSLAFGVGACTEAGQNIAIGLNARAYTVDSIAIGQSSRGCSNGGLAIGRNAFSVGSCGITIGFGAGCYTSTGQTKGNASIMIGRLANFNNDVGALSVAIGNEAKTLDNNNISIGSYACTDSINSIAIGLNAYACSGVAIGDNAYNCASEGLAIGDQSCVIGASGVAIATNTRASGSRSISIGRNACSSGTGGMSLGYNSDGTGTGAVAVGLGAQATQQCAVAVGCNACARRGSTALGRDATAFNVDSVAIGHAAISCGNNAVAIGFDNGITATTSNILGGCGNSITSAASNVTLVGTNNRTISGSTLDDSVVVDNLAILSTPTTNGANNNALVWNSTSCRIELNTSLGGGGGGISTANNGLTVNGSNVRLGGTLTGDTTIDLNTNGVAFVDNSGCATGQNSFAVGFNACATGNYSIAMGCQSRATALNSIAIGNDNLACSYGAIAMGLNSCAGNRAFAAGLYVKADGYASHAEGQETNACGGRSHAEGRCTVSYGTYSHAQNYQTYSYGAGSHAGGYGGYFGSSYYFVNACGKAAFNHSSITGTTTISNGANADQSAILGGAQHNINSDNVNAAIIGGNNIDLTGSTYIDTTAVGNLAIFETPAAGGSDDVLTWNPTTKKIRKVTQGSISDYRLKDDLQPIDNALDGIISLNAYKYKLNNLVEPKELVGREKYGLIAQDVEILFPHVVSENLEFGGVKYKTIDYKELVPVLVASIKQLENRVKELENK